MNTDYIIYNGELYHHGVKGMRWGVRKKRQETFDKRDRRLLNDTINKTQNKKNTRRGAKIAMGIVAAGAAVSMAAIVAGGIWAGTTEKGQVAFDRWSVR